MKKLLNNIKINIHFFFILMKSEEEMKFSDKLLDSRP